MMIKNYNCGDDASITQEYFTLTFSESVRGWVSFKSFCQENGVSLNNEYYTFKNSLPYKHHVYSVPRNTFYGDFEASRITFLLNQSPEIIKSYKTLNYEGSQANVVAETPGFIDSNVYQGYDNLQQKDGWFVQNIYTDMQQGSLETFVEKEGKWFNYLKGIAIKNAGEINTSEFSFQGIGRATGLAPAVYGCTDDRADNYDPTANVFVPGSCDYLGCTDSNADNQTSFEWPLNSGIFYNANIDDGSCRYTGCDDLNAINNNHTCNGVNLTPLGLTISTIDNSCCTYPATYDCDPVSGGCMAVSNGTGSYTTMADCVNNIGTSGGCPPCGSNTTSGCADPTAMNYDSSPNICNDPSLCKFYDFACYDDGTITTATLNDDNYNLFVSQAQLNSATNNGCTFNQLPYFHDSYSYVDPVITSSTFGQTINVAADNGIASVNWPSDAGMDCSCEYSGCMDDGYCTDNPDHFDPTSSNFISLNFHLCADSSGNSYSSANIGTPAPNYMHWATIDDGSCCNGGCTDDTALNYDSLATCDDGSCQYFACTPVTMPQFMLNQYPLLNATKEQTTILDPTFEELLESSVYEDIYGTDASNLISQDGVICTSCFEQTNISGSTTSAGLFPEDLATDPSYTGSFGNVKFHISPNAWGPGTFGGVLQPNNYAYGMISSFAGIEELALATDNMIDSRFTGSSAPFDGIKTFRIHLQPVTKFFTPTFPNQPQLNTPYSIPQTPDYEGIEFSQLDLLIPHMETFSLKNLPLEYLGNRAALDLTNFGRDNQTSSGDGVIALADCGITKIQLPEVARKINGIFIVNDTRYGTAGNTHTSNGVTTTELSAQHDLDDGERKPQYSVFCASQSVPQVILSQWDSNINNMLCDQISITAIGVEFDGSVRPINSSKAHSAAAETYDTTPCATQSGGLLGVGTFDIREYYDQLHAPWEDGSGNIVDCTGNFANPTYNPSGSSPIYLTNAAWERGVKFEQVNNIAGFETILGNPCTSSTGNYLQPCKYRIIHIPSRFRLFLVNLEDLTDIYIHPDVDPRSMMNLYSFSSNASSFSGNEGSASDFVSSFPSDAKVLAHGGFTTRGCHPDLKIHVGTTTGGSNTGQLTGRHLSNSSTDVTNTTRVQDFEMVFGTNDPTSEYYVPQLRDHFLRYFGANHRFVD